MFAQSEPSRGTFLRQAITDYHVGTIHDFRQFQQFIRLANEAFNTVGSMETLADIDTASIWNRVVYSALANGIWVPCGDNKFKADEPVSLNEQQQILKRIQGTGLVLPKAEQIPEKAGCHYFPA